ncbi:MAG TPA: PhzF family phenazine biosynthesis protein, partial [Acidobacteriaceae bacterium]|nr:PhzF family phenazine biosynthesis protein [Acidobacteriaceae bacterium]
WQNDAVFGPQYDPSEIAPLLGLGVQDLLEGAIPQTVSTGNPFCIVALRPEALTRLAIPQAPACAWLAAHKTRWFYCLAPEEAAASTAGTPIWRSRMQFYAGEDPATGSAAGCAISWLVRHGWAPSGQEVVLHQGIEIQRPSRIVTRAVSSGEGVSSITVAGSTIPVARGTIRRPF